MKKLLLVAAAAFIGLSASADVITTLDGITLTTDTSNPTYYFIKNLRDNNNRHQTYASASNFFTQRASRLSLLTSDELNVTDGTDARYAVGSLWYFTSAGDAVTADEKSYQPVHIVNAYTGKSISDPNGTWSNGATLYLVENTHSDLTGFCVTKATNLNNTWNNFQGSSELVDIYGGNDAGSIWGIETTDATKVAATLAAFAAADAAEINQIKEEYKSKINIAGFDASIIQTAVDAIPADQGRDAFADAYNNVVDLGLSFEDGMHMTFTSTQNRGGRNLIGYDGNNAMRTNDITKALFTLKQTTNGYYLKNEGNGKYLKHAANDQSAETYVDATTEATVYTFKVQGVTGANQVGIVMAEGTEAHNAINTNEQLDRITRWGFAGNAGSYWTMTAYTTESLKSILISAITEKESKTGTDVGKHEPLSDEDNATINAAKIVYGNEGATVAEIIENIAAVNAITLGEMNSPVAGRFYRIISGNNKYLAINATDGTATMQDKKVNDKDNNGAETVFYYDGSYLVSVRTGLVLGDFFTSGANKFVHKDATGAASKVIIKGGAIEGKYQICTDQDVLRNGTRQDIFISWGNNVAMGSVATGTNVPGNLTAFYWTVEELPLGSGYRWLPLYVGAGAKHVTVYSPVQLSNSETTTRIAEVHTLYVNPAKNTELVKTPIDDKVIPANTPCYVVLADGAVGANGSVYLPFNYSETAPQVTEPNALTGSFYATQKDGSKSYFTVGVDTDSKVRFMSHSAEYIPGFTAHYAVTENPAEKYEVLDAKDATSGISEVVAGGENGAKVIYDLQGRRVANASKGIFIINGVKTLVK